METGRARSVFYAAPDGLRLHARVWDGGVWDGGVWDGGASARGAVVCLPGLTRNARDFEGLAAHLAHGPDARTVVAFDLRGRGLSESAADWRSYAVPVEAGDVMAGLDALGIERADFIGTSRGGLVMHLLAGAAPARMGAAVLNDVGPELGRAGLEAIQTYLSRPGAAPRTIAEAARRQRAIHGDAFPALAPDDWLRFAGALYRAQGEALVPDHDPALLKTLDLIDWSRPLPDLWPQFAALAQRPLLVIRGENSRLLTPDTLAEMHRRAPGMRSETVQGQGHAPLLDTAGLPERIARFLNEAAGRG